MRNILLVATFATVAALGLGWWTAPDRAVAGPPVTVAGVSPRVPAALDAAEVARPGPPEVARRPNQTLLKYPGEHGVVPMLNREVGWPSVSAAPLSEPNLGDGLDWDTVAWSQPGEQGEQGEVVDPEWFGD